MAGETVSIEELLVSSLATNEALAKLLIEKGIITQKRISREDCRGKSDVSTNVKSHTTLRRADNGVPVQRQTC